MAEGANVLIVEARFYEDIADQLCAGAIAVLKAAAPPGRGSRCRGAFELPAAIAIASDAASERAEDWFDGYIALGCVIRGETSHYDHVCEEASRGLQDLALAERLAIGFAC